jgi:hypothetical protein
MTELTDRRTDEQIVQVANSLARDFYAFMGYEVPEGYRFDQAKHPQERLCWRLAVRAFDVIEYTDVEEALAGISAE